MPAGYVTSSKLREEIRSARSQSDHLFSILKAEALYDRPIAERHRVIFYIGHLDGFDSIQICREGMGIRSPEPELDTLFQAGIDPDSSHLPNDEPSDWPSLERVQGYVARCRKQVDKYLDDAPEHVILMSLEHRLMHLETLAYMFHNFDHSVKLGPDTQIADADVNRKLENAWREIPTGEAVLGRAEDGTFGWDNEYKQTRRDVPAFQIQRYSVTNGDYLRFVKDGAPMPHFWVRYGDAIEFRGMFRNYPLPLNWPVYVTQAQAETYAKWIGKILPTEEQFHRAAYGSLSGEQRTYPWGTDSPTPKFGNFDFAAWDPIPVDATPAGDSAFGVSQLAGNGWEWTSTVFGPFPGFQARDSYPGYSANFFDGDHYVMKGGSAQTAARLLRSSFRNWFRRDYPYVYATFRCVEQ
ncbi:MAG: SUMF1/EgtB/PvdO family nonheme iron enzyme [Acidobacteriaceae bacterium]|nr:SUMF1/EgtB/PvdO family nonheme iron enzyme [Acidobacteriaceae bacterium]